MFPSQGDLPNPGIEPRSPSLQADSLPAEPQGKPKLYKGDKKNKQKKTNDNPKENFCKAYIQRMTNTWSIHKLSQLSIKRKEVSISIGKMRSE